MLHSKVTLKPIAYSLLSCVLFTSAVTSVTVQAETLIDVYRDARKYDPSYAITKAKFEMAAHDKKISKSNILPRISASMMMIDADRDYDQDIPGAKDNYTATNWRASVVQPVLDMTKWHNYKMGDSAYRLAESELRLEEQNLIVRSVDGYLKVLETKNALRAILAEEAAVSQQLNEVQRKFEAGLIAVTDVLETQAIHDAAVVRRIKAESEKESAFENLRSITSFSYQRIDDINEDLPMSSPVPLNEELWVERANSRNPKVEVERQRLAATKRQYKSTKSERLPKVNAVLQHLRQDGDTDPALGSGFKETSIGLGMQWSIYEGGKLSESTKRARIEISAAEESLRRAEMEADRDTRNMLRTLVADVSRAEAGRQSIDSANRALKAVSAGYESGVRTIVDVLQAQQRLYAAKYNFAQARHDYIRHLINLKASVGELTEDYLREVNAYCEGSEIVWRQKTQESKRSSKARDISRLNRL